MPTTKTKSTPKPKDEKPGKVRRFLDFLGIKKRKIYDTSPELQRYNLDLILDDINHYADQLPKDHPRKGHLKDAVATLDKQGRTDIKKATEMAQGVLEWAAEEYSKSRAAQAPPQALQPPLQVQPSAPPPPKARGDGQPTVSPLAPQAPPAPPITAESLKQFVPERPLGSGQFATTYKMTGPGGQAVAVKVPLTSDEPTTPAERRRIEAELAQKEQEFRREAEFYEKVGEHPNIAKCYGYQTVGEGESQQAGLVLELVEGKTAKATMEDLRGKYLSGEVSAEEYFGVMQYTLMQMLQAADHMSKQGVSHRDLKPDNIMIDSATGDVKVVDFGCSQDIGQEPVTGNIPFGFTGPEIVTQTTVGAQEDAYGVGGTGYYLGEQRAFDYKRKPGQKTSEALVEYSQTGGNAIDIQPASPANAKPDDEAFEDLRDDVDFQLQQWEQSRAAQAPPNEVKQIRELSAQASDHEDNETFAEGLVVLRRLSTLLKISLAGGTPEKTFEDRLFRVEAQVKQCEQQIPRAAGLAEPGRLKALVESVRPLVDQARRHGDRSEYDLGLQVLEEAAMRLKDAERTAGQHKAETLYTDFINQLMHPDPAKRLTPEQAMNHPFMKNRMLDDEAARRVLQMQNPPKEGVADPGDKEPDEKRWQALDRAILEAERQVKSLKSALPQEAAERQSLLSQMKALVDERNRAKQKAADAWKQFSPLDDQLQKRLAAAQQDRDERAAFKDQLNQAGRLVKALASRIGSDPAALKDLFQQAETLSKPGGSLEAAREALASIHALMGQQFSDEAKQTLIKDGLAQVTPYVKYALERAAGDLTSADELDEEIAQKLADAKVQDQAAFDAQEEGDEDTAKRKKQMAEMSRKKAAEKKVDASECRKNAAQSKKAGEEGQALLQQVEQLAQSPENLDAALASLDRAAELLRVSLAKAPAAPAQQATDEQAASTEEQEDPYATMDADESGQVRVQRSQAAPQQQEEPEEQEDLYQTSDEVRAQSQTDEQEQSDAEETSQRDETFNERKPPEEQPPEPSYAEVK